MKLHFLGGADEVGASCLLVETAGRKVVVDGGIRMGGHRGDRLPDLSLATAAGGVDAVVLTHAHLDHSGALPLIAGAFPKAEIRATEPTCALLRILLLDAAKIMEEKGEKEQELPLYPLPAVETLLARTEPVRFYEPIALCEGDVRATFFPAGHVLGAAAVGLESSEGALLVTGDVSVSAQRTVPGMQVPRFRPDAVVCESTYGARLHASRKAEEQRLAATVVDAVRQGKRVLIPAFALGRAQEVILILRSVLARDDVEDFPVWVDGMVRAVCSTYDQHSPYLSRRLQHKVEEERELFYGARGCVQPVTSVEQREEIASGPPCVVITSSGMLSGGPSTFYAQRWCGRSDAVLCITGYQDEEAPGRKVQEVARGEVGEVNLGGGLLPIKCDVGTYALSAHADSQQLTSMMSALRPRRVFLVHGDKSARRALSETMAGSGLDVYLPSTGETIEMRSTAGFSQGADANISSRRQAGRRRTIRGIGRGAELAPGSVADLRRWCWEKSGSRRSWSVTELAEVWHGSESLPNDLESFRKVLWESQPVFRPDPKRPFHFRPSDPEKEPEPDKQEEPRDEAGRLEQNAAIALAQDLLGDEPTFYKAGADRACWTLRLGFHFPAVARARCSERLDRIARHTGWAVEIGDDVHLQALTNKVREILKSSHCLQRAPSVYKDDLVVEVKTSSPPDEKERSELSDRLERETGFSLRFKKNKTTPKAKRAYDASGRMEINLTYGEVDRAFAQQPHAPRKKSKKRRGDREVVELAFISPEVGLRYRQLLDELEQLTGWSFRVAEKVDQGAVLALARKLIPKEWSLKKNPGLDVANRKVMVKLSEPVDEGRVSEVAAPLEEESGFSLDVRT
jgi:Cft2 family RNA processing exonuclease